MRTVVSISEVRAEVARLRGASASLPPSPSHHSHVTRQQGSDLCTATSTIGFVPTMGALHVGHDSLLRRAVGECKFVVASIFVNPTQFGPGEDLDAYPKTPEQDLELCEQAGVDLLFMPTVDVMYGGSGLTTVHVSGLTEGLCGSRRPGHFDGVSTVVTKLLNIVRPDRAYFGEKDYQQLKVIQRMVHDLDMGVEIVGCETVREEDGLAMSSRNAYLSDKDRSQAVLLSQALRDASEAVKKGSTDAGKLIATARKRIESAGPCSIDYISVVDLETLAKLEKVEHSARMCIAVRIGRCRLIDNIQLDRVHPIVDRMPES